VLPSSAIQDFLPAGGVVIILWERMLKASLSKKISGELNG